MNVNSNSIEFDLHISSDAISPSSIKALSKLGLVEDKFYNNRNSTAVFWHATYGKHYEEPNDELWNNIVEIISDDSLFSGTVEEEKFREADKYVYFSNAAGGTHLPTVTPFKLETCLQGKHKACDIHINVNIKDSSVDALQFIEELNLISFDRTINGGCHRIYSLTFETISDGKATLQALNNLFSSISDFSGKMKLEEIYRFYVKPADATQLPIVRSSFLEKWLDQITL